MQQDRAGFAISASDRFALNVTAPSPASPLPQGILVEHKFVSTDIQSGIGLARASGGSVTETSERDTALAGAHVLYAKEWGSPIHYGDGEAEAELRRGLADWCVTEPWFRTAQQDCHLMHCLPVRRNVAVADHVLDGRRSRVVAGAANRMTVQMAVLHRMLATN